MMKENDKEPILRRKMLKGNPKENAKESIRKHIKDNPEENP